MLFSTHTMSDFLRITVGSVSIGTYTIFYISGHTEVFLYKIFAGLVYAELQEMNTSALLKTWIILF